MATGTGRTTGETPEQPLKDSRQTLEDWGERILTKGFWVFVAAIVVIALISILVITFGNPPSFPALLSVIVIAFLCLVTLPAILFAIVVWGIVKISEMD